MNEDFVFEIPPYEAALTALGAALLAVLAAEPVLAGRKNEP